MLFKFPRFLNFATEEKETQTTEVSKASYLEAGQILKDRRKQLGLSRNELALRTKITTPILEAIEEGWSRKFPERAYLSSMLNIIEETLGLERHILDGVLQESKSSKSNYSQKKITPGGFELFTSWQGSIIYVVLMLISIFVLNQNQKNLSVRNSTYLIPIKPLLKNKESPEINKDQLNDFYKASGKLDRRNNYNWLKDSIIYRRLFAPEMGLLEVKMNTPRNISIESRDKNKTTFKNATGSLKMTLTPPVLLKINPPLKEDEVIIWKGRNYFSKHKNDGVYQLTDDVRIINY